MLNLEIVMPEENQAEKDVMDVGGNILPLQIGGEAKAVEIGSQEHTVLTENGVALLDDEPTNSQPDGAYLINMDTLYSDSITGKGKRRWYFFQLTDKKKITIYMSPTADTSVDNDLVLYTLDTSTGVLTEVARSQNGPATYELLSYVGEAGIYLFCVAAYEGDTANAFSFMARLSDKWDEREGDDSIYQAKEQELNTVVKHTIDNSIDQDVSILKISQAGTYSLCLFNVPEEYNYQLQLLDANANMIGTSAKNVTSICNLPAGGYILKLVSVDGTFNPDVEVSVLAAAIPDDVSGYQIWLTSDGTHCVEIMESAKAKSNLVYNVRVDGKMIDYQHCEVEIVKASASSQSKCSMNTTKDSLAVGVAIGQYSGSRGCKNAILFTIDSANYGESHQLKSYHSSDFSGATSVIRSTDQYGMTYYNGFWSDSEVLKYMNIIFNLDTLEEIDFRRPNWFYGDASRALYRVCGTPLRANFESVQQVGYFPSDIDYK